mmetsp:Transcript_23886/g.68608  ORF Transcript_23886/g.68608 Transcript_23886/m.68608 type:complete len:1498 (-) Transcript_23886:33-4526(-)
MPPAADLKVLHGLLVADEAKRREKHAEMKALAPSLQEADAKIRTALEGFGVLPPSKDQHGEGPPRQPRWKRTLNSSLITVPSVPSQTTLVPLSSIPHPNRAKLRIDTSSLAEDALVEVPVAVLMPPEDGADGTSGGGASGGGASSALAARPLQGNLSSKLSDFTRGQVGRRRPFKAGGVDSDDLAIPVGFDGDGEEEEVPLAEYMSPEDCKMALDVLDKGPLEAWRDGSLITAPPSVTFKVGLGPQDVYSEEKAAKFGEKGCAKEGEIEVPGGACQDIGGGGDDGLPTAAAADTTSGISDTGPKLLVSTDGMWDKTYFDDDSLFADSSSESGSNEESSDDDDEKEADDSSIEEEDSDEVEDVSDQKQNASTATKLQVKEISMEEKEAAVEDVDGLLEELVLSTQSEADKIFSKKKKKKTALHPLLAVGGDPSSPSSSGPRKSWAVTDLLSIKDFNALVPNPAIRYPFELDDFQKQAVARLERSECIFVAAHTSAGKTVCAEYAIALARKHCTRAIYTSPIKALSNQKYRDFKDKFGDDVGLITGDLQIGADSSCLIMTTEILRSMLYRGADLIRDIEWVIFDEVHYINDTERGVVWEEVIIMLPQYVNMIFLSATTPNTIEFSDWIGRTKRKPVHVIRTDYRPVPLSHHLWAGQKLHKIMEGKSGFLDKGYSDAAKALLPASVTAQSKDKKGGAGAAKAMPQGAISHRQSRGSKDSSWQQQGNKGNWQSLIKFLDREGLTPTVIFSFSKKKCEEIANMLRILDLNTAAERNAAHMFAMQTMTRLSPNDASLPQVIQTCEMVKRGIGVHHGGLLPILKEMVEILFSRNLIKVLFATETFAMGVNMPARAVVFNSIRKHDGTQFRVLQPGEYTQMAGRAGRRGLDKVGTVILCCFGDEPPPQLTLRNMLTGSSTKLESQFRLTYNMILNLLRTEELSVEGMIKRSFSEFATQRALTMNDYPKLLSRGIKGLAKLEKEYEQDADSRIGAEDIGDYFSTSGELLTLNRNILSLLLSSAGGTAGGALVPGRILLVTSARKHGYVASPAIVVKSPTVSSSSAVGSGSSKTSSSVGKETAVCIVLLPESYVPDNESDEKGKAKPTSLNYIGSAKQRHYAIHEIDVGEIVLVSSSKHKIDSKALFKDKSGPSLGLGMGIGSARDPFARAKPVGGRRTDDDPFAGMMARGKKGGGSGPQTAGASSEQSQIDQVMGYLVDAETLEAKSSLGVMDLTECTKGISQGSDMFEFRSACNRVEGLTSTLRLFQSHHHPSIERHYAAIKRKETLKATVDTLRHLLSNESLALFPDFLQRKALLQTLGYVDSNDAVQVKGRVACEVNTCEELVVTEMVFEGVLNDLEPAEIVAALSALIFQEKSADSELDSELPDSLVLCCEKMRKIAINLGEMQRDHGLQIDPKDYCANSLKFGLVHVVFEWALGVPFSNICELTLVQEGSIVRCITRLDELCREVRNCARVVGNPTLYRKAETASVAIKRDIVFASSLYIS